jgi:Rieske Fe-S protein
MIGSAAIAAIVLPILQGCEPTSIPAINESTIPPVDPDGRIAIDVSDLTDGNPVKRVPGLKGPDGKGVLIARESDTKYNALSMECTHQQCDVQTVATDGHIPCPCHGSEFNLDGSVKQGPAEERLRSYDSIFDPTKKELRIKLS